MKLKHTQKKSANRNFLKSITRPRGVSVGAFNKLFLPKPNSKTQALKRRQLDQSTKNK